MTKVKNRAKYGPINQLGYLVDDLDASISRWISLMGVGPWTVFRNIRMDGEYNGQPVIVKMDVGLAYQGDMQIELIMVSDDGPSPYREQDGALILGFHHIAWLVENVDVEVKQAVANGLKVKFRAASPGTRVAYMEVDGEPGVLFEFIESEATRKLIELGIEATKSWDGSNPIQEIDFAA